MAMSIEVLCVGALAVSIPESAGDLHVAQSHPPKTDRGPSPLWQEHMSRIGGTLVHIFDKPTRPHLRWAYFILKEEEWKTFRFRDELRNAARDLLEALIAQSPQRRLWFYSDAQWSNVPKVSATRHSIRSFFELHDATRIRMNTAFEIAA